MYRIENSSEAIIRIQRYLLEIGDGTSEIIPNGRFDSITSAEVRKFQVKNGLADSGVIDYLTFSKLYAAYKNHRLSYRVKHSVNDVTFPVKLGDFGTGVEKINAMTRIFLKRYGIVSRSRGGKYFSSDSVTDTKNVRSILRLPEADTVDEVLYYRMKNDEISAFVSEQTQI